MKSPVRNAWLAMLVAFVLAGCQDATAPATALTSSDVALADRGGGDDDDEDDDDDDDDDDDGKRMTCRNQTLTGTLPGVLVPRGASCRIENAVVQHGIKGDRPMNVEVHRSTVRGDIDIKGGGGLGTYINISDGTVVSKGNVKITDRQGGAIALHRMRVEKGNVSLKRNVVTHSLWVGESSLSRNVQLVQNFTPSGSVLLVDHNDVGQNLLVIQNRGSAHKLVQFNTVRQTLECVHNDEPFTGMPNQARRSHGQCGTSGGRR